MCTLLMRTHLCTQTSVPSFHCPQPRRPSVFFAASALGVRREVGIHARTMNKLLLQLHINYLHSKHRDSLINSQPGSSNPPKVSHEKSLVSQETTANAFVAVKSEGKIRQSDEELLLSSELFSEDAKEISKFVADGFLPLKESVGHTEVEVVAGGLLGFLVGLAVYNFK
ncbi:hypothetical protein L195_g009411 [Trifolium pratense]|uniref:Uncharacterized protein n=1 Tax=Trifolium pratense TaxID=57577 RepID=A0A2K3PBZ7_TRIPR|nr:hypothetical protein L195_g009411 [Trifolium pratense]